MGPDHKRKREADEERQGHNLFDPHFALSSQSALFVLFHPTAFPTFPRHA